MIRVEDWSKVGGGRGEKYFNSGCMIKVGQVR